MKTFNAPVIEIEKLNIADIIATSGATEPAGCDLDCPGQQACPSFVCPLD